MGAGLRDVHAQQHSEVPDTRRLMLLVDASRHLADAGLEPPAVLERLCELVVPRLGHGCHVRLLSDDGLWLHPVSSAHADPRVAAITRRLSSSPLRADQGSAGRVLNSGRPLLLNPAELAQAQLLGSVEPPSRLPPLAPVHLLLLPLRVRQRTLGLLSIYRDAESPSFELEEQLLLQELADRAGLALDVAHAYKAERRARHAAEVAASRLSRLQRVTEALSEAVTPADVARVIVEEMISALGADRAVAIAPAVDDPELLEVVGHRGVSREALSRLPRFPPTAPLPVAQAYRTGEPVWLESREALLHSCTQPLVAEVDVTQAVVALPLRARGRTLGAIGFGFDSRRTFGTDERGLMLDLARQSAQALERAWLYESAQQARTRAERVAARAARLLALNTALSQVLTAERVAEVVIDQGVASLGAQVGCLWLANEAVTQARLLRSVGLPPELTGPLATLPLEPGTPLHDAIRRGQPVWLESREDLTRRYPQAEARVGALGSAELCSLVCLPLLVDGHGLGGLVFGFPVAHRFDDDERVFLSLLAHHAAQAFERARLFAQESSAREALRDAHRTLHAIVESSPTAITVLELDGTVRLWNPAAERIFGWKAAEVLGRASPAIPAGQEEEFRDNLARVSRGESILGQETRRQRRDGTLIDVSLWSSMVQVAENERLCLSVQADITERKRAEQALRFLAEANTVLASSLEHEVTLERVAHLAVPTYAEGCYVYLLGDGGTVSCVATAQAGAPRELPRELGQLASGASAVARVIGSGQPELCADRHGSPVPPATSHTLPCELAARSYLCVPLLVRGQTIGALSFVSSQHHYDVQDLALAQELARRAALAIDNARLYREARDAIRLREEFLSIASHELRTPITALQLHVQGLLGALARSPEGLPPERVRRGLEGMDRQVKRQLHLVNDLLEVSRLDTSEFQLRPEPLDFVPLTREVVERFAPELARTGSRLTLHAPAPVTGHWDRARLDQVVSHLVSNAVKYGQGNPIQLTVEAHEGLARLVVQDAGIGIAPEHQERVFGRFERAVSERNYGGFGLGLWMTRQVVEAMGGRITLDSQLGVGSTFTVELPREPT